MYYLLILNINVLYMKNSINYDKKKKQGCGKILKCTLEPKMYANEGVCILV